jgi:hypothetical protein
MRPSSQLDWIPLNRFFFIDIIVPIVFFVNSAPARCLAARRQKKALFHSTETALIAR